MSRIVPEVKSIPLTVLKTDGRMMPFKIEKIVAAIEKANHMNGQSDSEDAAELQNIINKIHIQMQSYIGEKIKTEACGISYYSYCSYFKYFAEILRSMGYKVDPVHEYSQSWRTRSGKIGYAYIWW